MPRRITRRICNHCGREFLASYGAQKYCPICNDAKRPESNYGAKYVLVWCADLADEGMIGHKNTVKIWLQLCVNGAIVRCGDRWLVYDCGDFKPLYLNPQPVPAQSVKSIARGDTSYVPAGTYME